MKDAKLNQYINKYKNIEIRCRKNNQIKGNLLQLIF